jgi:hypothetical protein
MADNCTHHFCYERSNGPTSRGVCKHCGEVRNSSNSLSPPKFIMELTDKQFARFRGAFKKRS